MFTILNAVLPHEETRKVRTDADPYIGKVIDKYKLVARLGAGGMGLVYRAEQARMDREVAIKLLPFTLVNDQVNVKRIEREARAMGNLRHPNIATIFDFGFSDQHQPYLVMELITGTSLGKLLQEVGSLEPSRAIKILAQAADAMDYAHRHGIIHRDLKPDNIMLDNHHTDDFVKILDFGIAKSVDEAVSLSHSQSLTRPGTIVGSPLYMSPEQCFGQKLDAKTDIYSLGVIMYETITGIIPCRGDTIYETVGKKTTEAPPPFPTQFSHLKNLEELVLSCLATLKDERPESMQVVKDRLHNLVAPTSELTPAAQEQSGGKHFKKAMVVSLSIAVLAVPFAVFLFGGHLTKSVFGSKAPQVSPVAPVEPDFSKTRLSPGRPNSEPVASTRLSKPAPKPAPKLAPKLVPKPAPQRSTGISKKTVSAAESRAPAYRDRARQRKTGPVRRLGQSIENGRKRLVKHLRKLKF